MPKTLKNAIKKSMKNESTALINGLTGTNASTEAFTEQEKLVASVFAIVKAPIKITGGLLMAVGGLILTPLCISLRVSTQEMINEEGARTECKGIKLKPFKLKTPFHSYRKAIYIENNCLHTFAANRKKCAIDIHLQDPEGVLSSELTQPVVEVNAKTTISGLKLMTNGLDRVVVGACDPIYGLGKTIFYSGKQLFKACKTSDEASLPAPVVPTLAP